MEGATASVLDYALSELCRMVSLGEGALSASDTQLRTDFFRVLNCFPVLCHSLLDQARLHEAFEYVLYYERVRNGVMENRFFLDGLPAGVQLFVGGFNEAHRPASVQRFKVHDAVSDRLCTVTTLEKMDRARVAQVLTDSATGLGDAVPARVRIFLDRTRAVCQGIRATERDELFRHCENMNCQRIFYSGEPAEAWARAAHSTCDDADDVNDSSDYWQQVGNLVVERPPASRCFCSRACYREHAVHLKSMCPDHDLVLDADNVSEKTGRARVAHAFRLALRRNEKAARALRTMRSKSRSNLAVASALLERHRLRTITALNVDLGVLYAASLVAESATLSRDKLLPGCRLYWRDDPSVWAKAAKAVMAIYARARRKEGIVSSLTTVPEFMEQVAARAAAIV